MSAAAVLVDTRHTEERIALKDATRRDGGMLA